MRRPSPRKSSPTLRLARLLLASLLACAVLAGAAPLGLVADAGGCSMPCCQGGDCADGSCTVGPLFEAETPKPAEESDPVCGADDAAATLDGHAAAHGERAATHHGHGAADAPPARPAEPGRAAAERARIEHSHRRHVSARNTLPGLASVGASVSEPCPQDCGAAPNSFTNLRRARDHATLAPRQRPPPPTLASRPRASAAPSDSSDARRGPRSPRGPPFASAVPTA